jgi:membrane-bound metal-dependent hydrolase YbcI (DUF457 family)
MADLLVHYAVCRTAAAGARNVVVAECLLLGAVLPDVLAKPFDVVLRLGWASVATHSPITWAALAYVMAHLFRAPLRPAACLGILLGGWIHFGVDLLRNALGMGAISLLYPFSREMVELGGLYYSEDTLRYAPAALGVIAIIEGWAWWQRRRVGTSAHVRVKVMGPF